MLKNVNQSMVNRSIARGGVNCKCVNGGSNGGGVNGGKITVEFNIHTNHNNELRWLKKEEAERVFREILSVDMEKYMFYCITRNDELTEDGFTNKSYINTPVVFSYNKQEHGTTYKGQKIDISAFDALNNDTLTFSIHLINNVIDYEDNSSTINDATIDEDIPDIAIYTNTYNLTLYYRER